MERLQQIQLDEVKFWHNYRYLGDGQWGSGEEGALQDTKTYPLLRRI